MRNGIQPLPHIPTPSEQLSLMYRTGDPSGQSDVDGGEIFAGLREESVQRASKEAQGAFVKGTVYEGLLIEAEGAIADLAAESAVET